MSVSLVVVACHHCLPVTSPLEIFRCVSEHYNANVEVFYHNDNAHRYWMPIFNFRRKGVTKQLYVEMPQCKYLDKVTSIGGVDIDWNSSKLQEEILYDIRCGGGYKIVDAKYDEETSCVRILQEMIEVDIDFYYTWYMFLSLFDVVLNQEMFDLLQHFRRKLAFHTRLWGCSSLIYFPDSEQAFDLVGETYQQFIEYLGRCAHCPCSFYEEKTGSLKREVIPTLSISDYLHGREYPVDCLSDVKFIFDDLSCLEETYDEYLLSMDIYPM